MVASPLFDEVPVLGIEVLALVLGKIGLVEVLGGRSSEYGGVYVGDGRCDDSGGGHGQGEDGCECEAHRE